MKLVDLMDHLWAGLWVDLMAQRMVDMLAAMMVGQSAVGTVRLKVVDWVYYSAVGMVC